MGGFLALKSLGIFRFGILLNDRRIIRQNPLFQQIVNQSLKLPFDGFASRILPFFNLFLRERHPHFHRHVRLGRRPHALYIYPIEKAEIADVDGRYMPGNQLMFRRQAVYHLLETRSSPSRKISQRTEYPKNPQYDSVRSQHFESVIINHFQHCKGYKQDTCRNEDDLTLSPVHRNCSSYPSRIKSSGQSYITFA